MQITYDHEGAEKTVDFDKKEIIIGRSNPYIPPDLNLASDITVSRTHARIFERNGRFWIEDLASKYGTLVNGVKQGCKRQLNPGDRIRIGECNLQVRHIGDDPHVDTDADYAERASPAPESAPGIEAEDAIRIDTSIDLDGASLPKADDSPDLTRDRLRLLLDLPLQLSRKQDLQSLLQHTVDKVVELMTGADRVAVILRNRDNNQLDVKAWTGSEQPAVSSSLCFKAMSEGRALIWRRIVDGVSSESMQRLEIKTGMYAPMLWRDKAIGVLCVDNPRRDSLFTEGDLRLLLAVANYAAIAVANHRLQEGI